MANAPEGAMAALIGLPDEKLDEVLGAASEFGTVVAANFNSPGQVVVSGAPSAVEAAMREGKARGAKIAVKLPVSGAFHSPLLVGAGAKMADLIDAAPLSDAKVPVFQNITASPATRAEDLRAALRPQMTSAVKWTQSVQNMIANGAMKFIELGPGSVLTGLVKRIDKSVELENL
jgi:[acyl-carrier-protein] S-malonyltransferase